ncbi:MAG: hypothetical protein IVW52_19575 [Acidimicrobiales bacterium]|nr:hypothetical protein [Acidimicrobiales bacterium]
MAVGRAEGAGPAALVPASQWLTALAFASVIVPFAIAFGRLLSASGRHLYLPDDLALIDLHTRSALHWHQQLGVFDHNGWNHPGPSYFYVQSLVYRVFGSGARSLFLGAILLNASAAVACLGVVRRRTTPARTLWAAFWICILASILAVVGPGSVTYSEGALGGLVSPWNPLVVIFPLLLLVLLCAGALDRSVVSLVGALVVGSFIVQTNISALVLVAALLLVTVIAWLVTSVRDQRRMTLADGVPGVDGHQSLEPEQTPSRQTWAWGIGGSVVLVLMWLPPVIQQLTNHPGNVTLIIRFFNAAHATPSPVASLRSVIAVYGVLISGPSEVMSAYLGHTPHHVVAAVASTGISLVVAVAVIIVGVRQRNRFAAGLGLLGMAGFVAMLISVSRVVGVVYGYLVVWAVALPVSSFIGAGMVRVPAGALSLRGRAFTSAPAVRLLACLVAVGASVVVCVRVVDLPALSTVSDPEVGALTALAVPALHGRSSVFVNDGGAGRDPRSQLLGVEKFIGVVNQLDERGYRPAVNQFWRAQFGPGFEADGTEGHSVELTTWTPASPAQPGYRGRVGDLAVTVTGTAGGRSTDPADRPRS